MGEEEDALLLSLVDAAKDYLEGAGVMEPEAEEPLYLLAVKALVLHYYDHRGLTESGAPGRSGIRNACPAETPGDRCPGPGGIIMAYR